MKHKFQYYRFFLSPIDGNLFSQFENAREDAFNEVFKKDFRGKNGKSEFAYKYEDSCDKFIHAKVGKYSIISRNLSPEEDYASENLEHWPNCHMFINVDNDPVNGQIIAFEYKSNVFSEPLINLRKWADTKNVDIYRYGYALSIHPINKKEDFWSVINKCKGLIEEVVFDFSSPNLFNLKNELEDELKNTTKTFNTDSAAMILRNKQGALNIPEDNPLIQQSVEYISKGGGDYKIKTFGEQGYMTSAKIIKTERFEIENLQVDCKDKETFLKVMSMIFS